VLEPCLFGIWFVYQSDLNSIHVRRHGRIDDVFAALDERPAAETSVLGRARLCTWTQG
jgi:hypothetical protein